MDEIAGWTAGLDELMGRIAPRFGRVEPRRRARAYLLGLLAPLAGKNSWTIAEAAGDHTPDGMQRPLNDAVWDADAVRDDLRGYVGDHLGQANGVLIVDLCRTWNYADPGTVVGSAALRGRTPRAGDASGVRHSSVDGPRLLLSEQGAPGAEACRDWTAAQAGQDGSLHRGIPRLVGWSGLYPGHCDPDAGHGRRPWSLDGRPRCCSRGA